MLNIEALIREYTALAAAVESGRREFVVISDSSDESDYAYGLQVRQWERELVDKEREIAQAILFDQIEALLKQEPSAGEDEESYVAGILEEAERAVCFYVSEAEGEINFRASWNTGLMQGSYITITAAYGLWTGIIHIGVSGKLHYLGIPSEYSQEIESRLADYGFFE